MYSKITHRDRNSEFVCDWTSHVVAAGDCARFGDSTQQTSDKNSFVAKEL